MDRRAHAEVKMAYVALARYFGQAIADDVLCMYAEDLADIPAPEVLSAMRGLRREAGRRFCPLPSDVRAWCRPAADPAAEANRIAGAITGGIARFGYTNAGPARAGLGEDAWWVVEQLGGWAHLCRTLNASQTGTFYAQARDLARARLSAPGGRAARPRLPAPLPRRLGAPVAAANVVRESMQQFTLNGTGA